jgi:hypothetical protein
LGPPFELKQWTFIGQDCDPLTIEFAVEDISEAACYTDGLKNPDDPIAFCDFEATITE